MIFLSKAFGKDVSAERHEQCDASVPFEHNGGERAGCYGPIGLPVRQEYRVGRVIEEYQQRRRPAQLINLSRAMENCPPHCLTKNVTGQLPCRVWGGAAESVRWRLWQGRSACAQSARSHHRWGRASSGRALLDRWTHNDVPTRTKEAICTMKVVRSIFVDDTMI